MPLRALALLTTLTLSLAATVSAGDWTNWRGPTFNGVAEDGNYPVKWSATENVKWSIPLPGPAGSTPVVIGDRIILTSPKDGLNAVICLDRHGKTLWETTVGPERPGKHKKGSGSNPSPVTNGKLVYVYYKSGDLACLDLNGKIVWQENLQKRFSPDTLWWDLGTSPVLTDKYVVVAVMQSQENRDGPGQSGESYLAAFEQETGKVAWKVSRELGAPVEAGHSYSTPLVIHRDGREELVVLGADHATGHDAATGKELWRMGGRKLNPGQNGNFRSISGPVIDSGFVIAPYARGDSLTAVRLGGSGNVTDTHIAWMEESGAGSDVPTPVAKDGRVYIVRDKGAEVICRDVKTGDVIWSRPLEKNRLAYSSSPVLAGDKLYVTREDSVTFVLSAKDGEVLAKNELNGEFIVATPVLVDDQILIRTFEKLYCIGK
jgi:outer membrane protein assembly factor BamB